MIVLLIPWLLLILVIIDILLMLKRKWIATWILLIPILVINCQYECIPLRFLPVETEGENQNIKVMCFNINGSSEDILIRLPKIIDIIKQQKPDVIFLAEYSRLYYYTIDSLLRKYFNYSTQRDDSDHYFYSKHPLSKQQWISKNDKKIGVYSSIMTMDGDSILLYGCHLASNNYTSCDKYVTPDSINDRDDLITYVKDIQYAYNKRIREAEVLAELLKVEKGATIIMGDFNDVGGSTALRILENAGIKDAWWEGGFGYGSTIHKPLAYRIDHIMFSPELKLKKIDVVSSDGMSDHDALYAEFELK